jgi:nucleoside-diphosphate-sugar epimerase
MKALVTGGGGFLGTAIIRQLRQRGDAVRSLSRTRHETLQTLGVEQVKGDLANLDSVSSAADGCDVIFHVAAKAGVWGPFKDYYRANVTGTRNVITACQRHHIPRLVYTSSPSVVFDGSDMEDVDESAPYATKFETPYSHTKAEAEQYVLAANTPELATVALRPHLIWGPGDNHLLPRLACRARAGQLRRIGPGDKRIDTIYIDNAADAHLLAADRLAPGAVIAGKAYFISQGEPIETWEIVNRLLTATGAPPIVKPISKTAALALATLCELWHQVTLNPGEPVLTRFVVRQLTTSHWYNISAARRDLGFNPRISTAEGLQRLKHQWKA